jgi:hypothetical protein
LNREENQEKRLSDKRKEKIKEMLLFCGLALILLVVVWQVFGVKDKAAVKEITYSEKEIKVARMLTEMEGVGDVEVMIYEGEEGVESVVVLCDGATDLRVIISVREAVATALGTEEKRIKVYLKKE